MVVTIGPAQARSERRRFLELPLALHRGDAPFAHPVMAFERWRLSARNPFFDQGDAMYFLARKLGRPVGRITAHITRAGDPHGWFGFLDAIDDETVVTGLLDAAQEWLVEHGCGSMTGPVSFTADVEAGLLVDGHDAPGLTGRPWHPRHLAEHVVAAGLEPAGDHASYRLPATGRARDGSPADLPEIRRGFDGVPAHAGRYGDPRLALATIAAVPDVSAALRDAGARGSWDLARRARDARWSTCVVVHVTGDPALSVPQLQHAAGAAGYEAVVAPWSPGGGLAPETVHRLFRREW